MKSFLIVVLDSTASGAIGGLFILTIILGLYFVPGILATARHSKNAAAVWVIDIFLGWTMVGWVVALAMAFGETREEAERPRYVVQAVPIANTQQGCASCGQPSGAGKFCQNCGSPVATAV